MHDSVGAGVTVVALAIIVSCAGQRDAEVRTVGATTSPDGVAISFETAGAGDSTLVFVHGWAGDRNYWEPQLLRTILMSPLSPRGSYARLPWRAIRCQRGW